jgi:7,8-dihydroneopterin aldolase/epimerase/oxygenase
MSDKIKVCNMVFYAYHGTTAAERKTGNRFEVDVEVFTDLSTAGKSDNLEDTISYTRIYHLTSEFFKEEKYKLVEKVAYLLADKIMDEFSPEKVIVRIRKMIPPIPGNLDHIEIEIEKP